MNDHNTDPAQPIESPHARGIERKPCRSCAAPMLWCRTEAGKAIPIDAVPDPNGNIVFTAPGEVRYLKRGDVLGYPPPVIYTAHWASCPAADRFRAKPAKAKHTDPAAARVGAGIIASFRAATQRDGVA